MIRIKLKQLLDQKSFNEGIRITLIDVADATNISRPTLNRIANERGYNAGIDNIDRLCAYFNCTPGELLEYIPNGQVIQSPNSKVEKQSSKTKK